MSTTTIVGLILVASLVASAAVALWVVRGGRTRAQTRLAEVPGDVRRTTAATSLGLTSLGVGQLRGTGTLILTDGEVAFAQWRPDRLVRIPRPAIVEVDTTRTHLGKTMNSDLLRIRWGNAETDVEDTVAFFVRDLDPWLDDLGGQRPADDAAG
jgi:hypothetical protein